jgi:tetratricopeptide (TPR) repeat protein
VEIFTQRFELNNMILYRPVGLPELELIYDSGMRVFPARLPQQPIFYPVLELEYARQVASDWNVKSGQHAGYVTQFKVEDSYISAFEKHRVGGTRYQEFWIPAEEVEEFNRHITGHIKVLEGYFGKPFQGFIPDKFSLQGKNAVKQFNQLTNLYLYKRMEFYLEIKRNHKAVFLHYPYWLMHDFKNPGLKEKIIKVIKEAWFTSFPNIPLPVPPPVHEDTPSIKPTVSPARKVADPPEEDTTPVVATDSEEPLLVNPDEEEITPQEEMDSYSWVDPEDDDAASVKQIEPYSSVYPVHQDANSVTRTASQAQHSADPDDENMTLDDQWDSDSSSDPVREDTPLVRPIVSHRTKDSFYEAGTLEEQTDSPSSTDPVPREVKVEKPIVSDPSENSIHKVRTPVTRLDSPSLTRAVDRDSTIARRTVSHFAQGVELGLSGKYYEAIDELTKAVQEDPNHVIAHTSLGVAFHRVGKDDHALACYETVLKIDHNSADAHYFRSNILYSRGNIREGMEGYATAIGLEPSLIESHEKPTPQDRLVDYSPAPAQMHRIAKPARRILELNKSLESNPKRAALFKERAVEYIRLSNFEQAIADYTSSLAIQPDDADALHSRGLMYEQIGESQRAQEDYQEAIRINPHLAEVYINRGIAFGQMGNFRQSIVSLTDGIRLAPQNPDAYFNRGTSYFQLGDLEEAIADFSAVIGLSPNDEAAYYWRGISYEQAGHRSEALTDYRQFLALSQDENTRTEIEEKLSQWNDGTQMLLGSARDLLSKLSKYVRNQSTPRAAGQQTELIPAPAEAPSPEAGLYDLILALGERALQSIWFGSGVECYGEKADELYAFAEQEQPISGHDLLSLASGIRQTIQGDFFAFDPGATAYWIFLRAWEGSGFYIETNDSHIEKQLQAQYQQAVEEVEGAEPPYAGFFIRI